MTKSLFVYSSANVYKMSKNLYPVNTKVTIDGQGKGTIITHNVLSCDKKNLTFVVIS